MIFELLFSGCGNENNKINTELQNYSSVNQRLISNGHTVNGHDFKKTGSLPFLIGKNLLSENYSYFFNLDSLIHVNDYRTAAESWKASKLLVKEKGAFETEIMDLENQLLFAEISFHLKNYAKCQQIIDDLGLKWKGQDFILQFYFLKSLEIQAEIWNSIGSYQASLSSVCYGLHLIETSIYNDLLLRQKASLHNLKAVVITNERGPDMQESAKESIDIARTLFQQLGEEIRIRYLDITTANIHIEQNDFEAGLALLNTLDTISENKYYLSYLSLNKGFLYYEKGDVDAAIKSYNTAIHYIQHKECNNILEILYDYLFYCYLEKEAFGKAEEYMDLITEFEDCNESTKTLKTFYNAESLFAMYRMKYQQNNNEEDQLKAYTFGTKHRSLAKSLFGSKDELHLGDLYIENSTNLLSLFESSNVIKKDSPIWNKIMRIIFDSKNQNRLSANPTEEIDEGTETPAHIIQAISSTNDFKYNDSFSSKEYESIYQYFLGSTQTQKILEKRNFRVQENQEKIEMFELENQHLVFIAHSNVCWKVFIDKNQNITLEKLSLDEIRKLSQKYISSILDKKEDLQAKEKLAASIIPDNLDPNLTLTILADDILRDLPFATFIDNSYHKDLWFRPNKTKEIRSIKAAIFSYSDEESIEDLGEKQFVELQHGLSEAYDVAKILGSSPKINKDETFNKRVFQEKMKQELVHVSSHAVVKAEVRQNCFLLLNKNDGSLDTLYASEISSYENVPSFLYLSTCNSGTGYTLQGNGKYSLSRAFMERGTETVISTLWPIDDRITRAFSAKFYEYWTENKSASKALRDAQKSFMNESKYQEPYYWAGFILEGNGNVFLKN